MQTLQANSFLNPSAVALWQQLFRRTDRILVTGATGWFGQTVMHLFRGMDNRILPTASKARYFRSRNYFYRVEDWSAALVKNFTPTVVIDCAFLTRELVSDQNLTSYIQSNEMLTKQMLFSASLPSVERALTISSGAAVFPQDAFLGTIVDNPYGYLKRVAEEKLMKITEQKSLKVGIARAWSVSGAFVGKPQHYALTDMILAARSGEIQIKSNHLVYRKYAAVEDLLSLTMAEITEKDSTVINSEGPLVEMAELASAVAQVINPSARIYRPELAQTPSNDYYSPTNIWPELSREYNLQIADLVQQIEKTNSGLVALGS